MPNLTMRITAKTDYAVRAMVALGAAERTPVRAEEIAVAQGIPTRFLLNILNELKHHRLVDSRRGVDGGYWLARPASDISIADVIRAIEGPLADVHGTPPEDLDYTGPVVALRDVWVGVRHALRSVLENVSLQDVAENRLPAGLRKSLVQADAWQRR